MSISRCTFGLSLLALTLCLTGTCWPQTSKPSASNHATLYGRAVSLLDQAQQLLNAGNISAAKAQVNEANSLFTLLKNEYASKLAEHKLSPQEDHQIAINQKLAADTQAQADRLMETASSQDKEAQELELQGREEASKASYRQSKDSYNRAQSLYVKSAIYALRNQQMLLRFLAP